MNIIPTVCASGNDLACDYVSLADLEIEGFGIDDVRKICPMAAERTARNGEPYWALADLEPLFGSEIDE